MCSKALLPGDHGGPGGRRPSFDDVPPSPMAVFALVVPSVLVTPPPPRALTASPQPPQLPQLPQLPQQPQPPIEASEAEGALRTPLEALNRHGTSSSTTRYP
jgi:hypothetical protein